MCQQKIVILAVAAVSATIITYNAIGLFCSTSLRVILFYFPPPGVTKYCIQSCQAANAIIANAVATVTNSMTFSVNLLYRCVNSCTNIAIFLAIPPQ